MTISVLYHFNSFWINWKLIKLQGDYFRRLGDRKIVPAHLYSLSLIKWGITSRFSWDPLVKWVETEWVRYSSFGYALELSFMALKHFELLSSQLHLLHNLTKQVLTYAHLHLLVLMNKSMVVMNSMKSWVLIQLSLIVWSWRPKGKGGGGDVHLWSWQQIR